MPGELESRLRCTDHDQLALDAYREELVKLFKLAGLTAITRNLVPPCDERSIREVIGDLGTAGHPIASAPLFEYVTCALRDAVTKNTHTPEGLGAFILAARDCRDTPSAVKLVAPEHLSTYKVILDEVVASQDDIESRSVTATLLNDTATSDYVQRCVDLIDRHVPHDLVELSTFANTVVAFDHPDVSGTSVAGATGLIFIRPEDRTIDTIDHLIHEWSHNKFETILHTHRLWTDDERLHHSPIRGTPRPLYGVFHAIYVLLVVSEAMVHLMHVDELGDDASRKIDSFVTECDASLRALSDEPSLTEHGHKFVDLCLHWAETISKERSAA